MSVADVEKYSVLLKLSEWYVGYVTFYNFISFRNISQLKSKQKQYTKCPWNWLSRLQIFTLPLPNALYGKHSLHTQWCHLVIRFALASGIWMEVTECQFWVKAEGGLASSCPPFVFLCFPMTTSHHRWGSCIVLLLEWQGTLKQACIWHWTWMRVSI